MGSLNVVCPLPTSLTAITAVACPEKFGQIQRIALRINPGTSDTVFTAAADIIDATKWTTAMAASDVTKIVVTPFISSLVIPPGDIIAEEGNNNNTVNGIPIVNGIQNVHVTGRFLNLTTAIAELMRGLTPYTILTPGFTKLEAFFFNEFGQIIRDKSGTRPKGFPVYNLVVPSVGSEGLNKPNVHNLAFDLIGGWDKYLTIDTPITFNPLNF